MLEKGDANQWRAGGDVRYVISSTTTSNLTINPDFALIEADQEQINLTRFELRLPEKRPFFLEGDELLRQRLRTFYSRRIEDITVGAKILGKQGPWTTAAIYSHATPAGSGDEQDLRRETSASCGCSATWAAPTSLSRGPAAASTERARARWASTPHSFSPRPSE